MNSLGILLNGSQVCSSLNIIPSAQVKKKDGLMTGSCRMCEVPDYTKWQTVDMVEPFPLQHVFLYILLLILGYPIMDVPHNHIISANVGN